MKSKLLLFTLLFVTVVFGQRTCGTPEKMEQLQFNPLMKALYDSQREQSELAYQQALSETNTTFSTNVTKYIPVAVHFPSAGSASTTLRNCLRTLAQNQISILNADYNATNTDIATWNSIKPTHFPSINAGILDVQYVIATQNHPAGFGLTNGQPAVTFGYDFGNGSDWDPTWAGYLNIIVKDLGGGILGYAYLGSNPNSGAAVFINTFCFGSGAGCSGYIPSAPFNLGRTLTHELGHYMNLNHIWGDATCGNDLVADTPLHNTANFDCPSVPHFSTCSGTPKELTMNFMDYTDDACMYMFTAGQATRSNAHLNNIYSNFNQTTLSQDPFVSKDQIVLYPNPSNGSFAVTLSNNDIINSIKVYDISGRLVYEKNQLFDNEININLNVNSGIYNLILESHSGNFTTKISVN